MKLKIHIQTANYLSQSSALWDFFFHLKLLIRNSIAHLGNIADLGNWFVLLMAVRVDLLL